MVTMQIDMTAQLAVILYGLAVAVGLSVVGILLTLSRSEARATKAYLLGAYRRSSEMLRNHLRIAPPRQRVRSAH
jgi:hypothetical protein